MYNKIMGCLASIREKIDFQPEIAVVLGSGLGDFANEIRIADTISYTDIEGFPVSTVKGHAGKFVFGYVEETPVVIMQGRVHYYEGYEMSDVVLPTRLMGMMGAKKILLTNAAGGCNPEFKPGDLMIISDHITTGVPSPLIGKNIEELGTRFPDMSEVYSRRLQEVMKVCADECGIEMRKGVYVQFTGPNYYSYCSGFSYNGLRIIIDHNDKEQLEADARGHGSMRYFVHYKHGCRNFQSTAQS